VVILVAHLIIILMPFRSIIWDILYHWFLCVLLRWSHWFRWFHSIIVNINFVVIKTLAAEEDSWRKVSIISWSTIDAATSLLHSRIELIERNMTYFSGHTEITEYFTSFALRYLRYHTPESLSLYRCHDVPCPLTPLKSLPALKKNLKPKVAISNYRP
jgi:hypothetical protein